MSRLSVRRPRAVAAAALAAAACLVALLAVPSAAHASSYADTVLADGPAAYWRLGEVSNGWTPDIASGPSERGLGAWPLTGHVVANPAAPWGHPGAVAGDPDTALELPGEPLQPTGANSDWMTYALYRYATPHPFVFAGREPFTLEAWIRPRRLNENTRRVFSSERNTADSLLQVDGGYLVGVRADGLVFSRYAAGRWSTLKTSVAAGRWQHVAASYDGTVMRLYVDGRLRGSGASTIAIPNWTTTWFSLGSKSSIYRFFAGGLDEAAVYARALPADRVLAHYRAGAEQ